MVFSTPYFLFLYLPMVLLLYYISPLKWRNLVLMVVNLIFYGWGEPVYIIIMLVNITANYVFGLVVTRCKQRENQRGAKIAVALSVVFNLALLGFFKYWDFIAGSLASLGLLSQFVGMLTDSRSFVSYPRHEYFRRILCNLIGEWVENGEYPADMEALETMVKDICYYNAKRYFGL